MSVCLRCDWRGETAAAACPRCEAPLFRPDPSARRPAGPLSPPATRFPDPPPSAAPGSAPVSPAAARADDAEPPAPERTSGWRRLAAALPALALVLVVAVVTIVTDDAEPPNAAGSGDSAGDRAAVGPVTSPKTLRGSLVYSRFTPTADRVQLWVWDLERNEVREGPIVPKPVRLVAATAVRAGDVGLTWRRPDGTLEAGLLRSLEVDARLRSVLSGELVAWSPRGGRVSAARLERDRDCPRPITIRSLRLRPRLREPAFRTRLCGDVLSLAGDGAVTYFTLRVGDRVHVAYGGIRRPTIILRDHAILDVSWAGDMIVQAMRPPSALAPFRREPSSPDGGAPLVPGHVGYFTRRTTEPDPVPVPFTTPEEPFTLGAILAWSPNSFEALAVGAFRGTPGVYVLDTLPGDGIESPRWLLDASGPTSATYTGDGVPIVLTGGDVHAVVDDVVTEVPMPVGTPLADGRVAWIP